MPQDSDKGMKDVVGFYKNSVEEWSHEIPETSDYMYDERRHIDMLTKRAGYALDVGCGRGTLGILLAQRNFRTLSVDMLLEMAKLTQKNAESAGIENNLSVLVGDIRDLHFRNRRFDVLLCSALPELYADITRLLKKFKEITADEGEIVVMFMNSATIPGCWIQRVFKDNPRYKYLWSPLEIKRISAEAGLVMDEVCFFEYRYLLSIIKPLREYMCLRSGLRMRFEKGMCKLCNTLRISRYLARVYLVRFKHEPRP